MSVNSKNMYIDIRGRRKRVLYRAYNFLCIITFGILYIIANYNPWVKIYITTRNCKLKYADCALIINKFGKLELKDILVYNVGITKELKKLTSTGKIRILDTEYGRFIYDEYRNKFITSQYVLKEETSFSSVYFEKINKSVFEEKTEILEKEVMFGKNINNVKLMSTLEIFLKNTFNVSNYINIFCIVLWFNIEYKVYGTCIGLMMLYSYVEEMYSAIKQKNEFAKSMSSKTNLVFRGGKFVPVDSHDIYPGDMIYIDVCKEFTCDALILKGDVIADENFLTGESIPICKSASQKSIVYSGTSILRSVDDNMQIKDSKFESLYRVKNLTKIQPIAKMEMSTQHTFENKAIGLVIATGFNTARGKIMKDIINPSPVNIPFLIQAYRYIFYTILISLILSLMMSCYFYFVLSWTLLDNFIYTADLFFTLASPALYASLSVGIQISNKKLKEANIKCNNLSRIYVAGHTDIAIFDKTGTLTSEGMDLLCIADGTNEYRSIEELDNLTRMGLSCCHSVYELDGKYSGDSLDIQMFIFSKSELSYTENNSRRITIGECNNIKGPFLKEYGKETDKVFYQNSSKHDLVRNIECNALNKASKTIEIVKTYDFTSDNKRMSVIIKDQDTLRIFCKGSPDIMMKLMKNKPENYENTIERLSLSGYRIITLAYKNLEYIGNRKDNEKDLIFLGLIVFSNKLNPETSDMISELNDARIKSIICTGDNILTAISVGRECKIIDESVPLIFPVVNENCKTFYDIEWICLEGENYVFDRVKLALKKNDCETEDEDFVVGCEGEAYEFLRNTEYLDFLLNKGVVFARFKPNQKKKLVEDYKNMGQTTLFCGDGANDSGAISTADAGIALAKNEASLASSFSAENVGSVPILIKECRNAYVTSIARFKFISISYILAFACLTFLVMRNLFLSDFQTLHVDIFIIVPMMLCISNFKRSDKLHYKKPDAYIFNSSTFISFFTSLFFQLLTIGILSAYGEGSDEVTEESKAGSIVFFVTAFQSVFNGIYLGDCVPHRESIKKNRTIIVCGALFCLFNLFLLLMNWFAFDFTSKYLSIYLFVHLTLKEYLIVICGIVFSVIACFYIPACLNKYFSA